MYQIVPQNYFVPSVLTGVLAYFAVFSPYFSSTLDSFKYAITSYYETHVEWVDYLREHTFLFKNETSPFTTLTLYIVSNQLTNLQYIAYISIYILAHVALSLYKTTYSLIRLTENTYSVVHSLTSYKPNPYALDYYIPKENYSLVAITLFFTVPLLAYFIIRKEKRVVAENKKEKVKPIKHSMTLRKRATLMLSDHSLSR